MPHSKCYIYKNKDIEKSERKEDKSNSSTLDVNTFLLVTKQLLQLT